MGRDSMQFPQSIPWGPGLVGAAGRDSMQFPRWIPGDLVGVPSSDQRRPGQHDADVCKHWVNVCRRRQTLGERRQTPGQHDAIPCGPGLVGAAGRDSSAQPWIHGGQHDADVGKPGRLKESLSTVCTVPIGGDRSKRRRGTQAIPHAVRVLSEFCPSQFGQFSELE